MKLSGHTKPFAVLGHPIGHTLSPVMHNAAIQALQMDAIYLAFDVAPENLLQVLPAMRDMGFRGVNLTVPLKETAFRGLPNLEDLARTLGAVNTVEFLPDGSLRGHNTDGPGFLTALRESFALDIAGLDIFLFGCGGAGRAVAITSAMNRAASLLLCDVDPERAVRLQAEIQKIAPACRVSTMAAHTPDPARTKACQLIVQATPVGMKTTDPAPLPPNLFTSGQFAYDLVYMYPETAFMRTAIAAGAKAANGLGMLLHQGARAFTIWTGIQPPVAIMRAALEQAVYPN